MDIYINRKTLCKTNLNNKQNQTITNYYVIRSETLPSNIFAGNIFTKKHKFDSNKTLMNSRDCYTVSRVNSELLYRFHV